MHAVLLGDLMHLLPPVHSRPLGAGKWARGLMRHEALRSLLTVALFRGTVSGGVEPTVLVFVTTFCTGEARPHWPATHSSSTGPDPTPLPRPPLLTGPTWEVRT